MRNWILLGLSLSLLPFAVGCGSPLVGEWDSDKKIGNGKDNNMFIFSDATGEATIYAAPSGLEADPATYQRFEFDIEWTEVGSYFELEMDCSEGPCDGNDFTMECEVIRLDDDREKLDCDGDKNWKGYVFNWERVQ